MDDFEISRDPNHLMLQTDALRYLDSTKSIAHIREKCEFYSQTQVDIQLTIISIV
jgi:hypothetical protein